MLRLAIALCLALQCLGQAEIDDALLVKEKNVLSPPYFNIASGKRIDSTSTCGTSGPELFCKLTGGTNFEFSNSLHQGQVCDICNSENPSKAHPANNAIDGTEKWWQSPPLSRGSTYNKVNVTIHLGQVFHVAYVLIKFANSPRAGTWVLERSSDYGKTYQPWQYFANTDSDCYNLFGMDSLEEITRDDSVKCTSDYSSVVPLENGEVIVSMVKGRPGSHNFSYATVLQEWSKATNIRLRFLRTKTLLGHLMAVSEEDPTVTRRYYYSIKDISVGGRCVCNGHADICRPDENDLYKAKCVCQHNTCGSSCEYCCPGFEQKAWRAAVPESTNECEACNCHGHATACRYDEDIAQRRLSLDLAGNYEGGGVCINCTHNTAGINCEQCAPGFWRPSHIDPREINGCRPCECDSAYTLGSCEPNTGRCYCKVQYAGDRCDSCAPGYYDFPECRPCDCYYNGTLDGVCLPVDDAACPCKYNYAGRYCSECAPGFYNFPKCDYCDCQGEGVSSNVCDVYTGECPCAEGFTGPACDQCAPGYFRYPLCQRCLCIDVGTTDAVCDSETGECFCDDKYTGASCNECKPGFYGFPTCEECQCFAPGSIDNTCDQRSGRCYCKPNYSGDRCEECAPEFYGYPNCVSCACNVDGSLKTTCDATTGQCLCRDNIGGQRCDMCTPDYFNFPRCEECSCDARGIRSLVPGVCLAFTTGQCECKENVMGKNCDMCKPLHYDLDRGCVSCNCFIQGTLDGVGECDTEDGQCFCKPYTCTQRCSQCEDGFYSLEERNYLGCTSCECDIGGAMTTNCDKTNGQCRCKNGIGGRRCNRALDGYFSPTLYQNQYEVENGRTPDSTTVRYGFDATEFPEFSMKGYAKFSGVQPKVVVPITIFNDGLYRLMFRYVYPGASSTKVNVTLTPGSATDGSEQSYPVTFDVSAEPRMINMPYPLVLNRGTWTVVIEAQPGLLIDYLVLLPAQFYEPGILQLSTTVPCVPVPVSNGKECVMFSHPDLSRFTAVDLVGEADSSRLSAPSTAHPDMVHIDATTGNVAHSQFTTEIALPRAGKYILVLEYASNVDRLQTARVTVTDGASNTYDNAKFNIYACPYSFLCRQVALGVLNEVQVFDMSLPVMRVTVNTDSGSSFYVKSVTAIPLADWTMELVEPKPKCITMSGPEFDQCIPSSYKIPADSSIFRPPPTDPSVGTGDEEPVPPEYPDSIGDRDVDLVHLDDADKNSGRPTTLQIPMDLQPGRYVFVVHYYNPDHTGFKPRVVIDGGVTTTGSANISYCPFSNGCRGVVTSDDGRIVVDITVPTTLFTITVPDGKAFWIEYLLAIPEEIYERDLLDLAPIDKSSDFIRQCASDGQQSFYNTIENPSDFCRDSIFSLTVDYNDGGLECNCSGAGTVGGGDAVCADYGGQCPCKPNVIGRRCDQCRTGYFGFPNCEPCDCGGSLCDPVSGECICPDNTVKPDCNTCAPFTHSFDPLKGCVECDCNVNGVVDVTDTGCDPADGQCRCKENVAGTRCDRCAPGYFGFPDCQKCTCDERGALGSDGCDPVTGQCACKKNVEGLQCNLCKPNTFYLDINNPLGCTECFCFGVGSSCTRTQYPMTEIHSMDDWIILNLVEDSPEIVQTNNGQTINVDIDAAGGQQGPTRPNIYWAAPRQYLGPRVGSYGGELRYTTTWSSGGGRGDAGANGGEVLPAPLQGRIPDVILKGSGFVVGWTNPSPSNNVRLELVDRNFYHDQSGNPVTRAEMMMILAELQSIHIRASPEINLRSVSLEDVVMTTTGYDLPIGSGQSIQAVEECVCPEGYTGHSCEQCARGHRRDQRGLYFGVCVQCLCYPNCDTCDEHGHLTEDEQCKQNTVGPTCDVCIDGYIKNTTSGDVKSCKPCPCPFPDVDGNFAETCEQFDGELVCHCKPGYAGERCELCASGYFGNPSVRGGFCQPCNCHGNLDPNLIMEVCDPLTGVCEDCQFNTGGKYCQICADGYYGDAVIARNCTECDCDSCGTNKCDHVMGHCSCQDHVIGQLCDTCEPGYWNFQSCTGCQNCNCAEGAIGKECDIATGQCKCAPNIVGLRCDRCAPGFYDYSAVGCKPCKCRNNGPCNPKNGQCECPPGITGDQCDQCELSRHILHEGEEECRACGTCTDDLLDEVEPLTKNVTDALNTLANVSLGVVAYRRLDELQNMVNDAMANLDVEEGFITSGTNTVGNLLNGGIAGLDEMVSGSGANALDEVSSGMNTDVSELRSSLLTDLDGEISRIEVAVSQMCNHTDMLLTQVQETENMTMEKLADARVLDSLSSDFNAEAKNLKDKLSKEATGDSDDYEQKLAEAERMVGIMEDRDFSGMMIIADEELTSAQDLFSRVTQDFTEPADNVSARVGALSDDFATKQAKLRELRNKMNNATQRINDATTMNAVNQKNLSAMTESINNINSDSAMANDLLNDAEQLLNASKDSVNGPIKSGIDELGNLEAGLTQAMNELQPVVDQLVSDLEAVEPLVNQSMEKANQLASDAAALQDIVNNIETPENAANAYQRIVIAMTEAANAAENALNAAINAEMDVADKNLEEAAQQADQRSSTLLAEAEDLQRNGLTQLEQDMQTVNENLATADATTDSLQGDLDAIKARLNALDRSGIETDLDTAKTNTDTAVALTNDAEARANELQAQINNAPDTNIDMGRELEETRVAFTSLPEELAAATSLANHLIAQKKSLENLDNVLAMPKKIQDIQKKIALTRDIANSVKSSIKFRPRSAPISASNPPEYVELRIPPPVVRAEDHVRADFLVKLEDAAAENSLMMIGDGTASGGDYMAVETRNGHVFYHFKVGDGVATIESSKPINTNQWHKVAIERTGNEGKLIIEYPDTTEGRGDGAAATDTITETLTGVTDSDNLISSIKAREMAFFVGGVPRMTPGVMQNREADACISDVRLNYESVGLWNFKSYAGPKPGRNCLTGPSGLLAPPSDSDGSGLATQQVWRFRGLGSYIRIRLADTDFLASQQAPAHYVGFTMDTLQDNSLLFLVGETTEQFMALEVVNGKLKMSWNFGFADGPMSSVVSSVDDVNTAQAPIRIRAGVAPRYKMMVMSVDLRLKLQERYPAGTPNITGDIYIGGGWYSDINPDFYGILSNVNVSYRGCLSSLNFNSRTFDIQNAIESYGVTRGCIKETAEDVSLDGTSYIMTSSPLRDAQLDGMLAINTDSPTGTLLSANDPETNSYATLSLENGRLVLSHNGDTLTSNGFYADGQSHLIKFNTNDNGALSMQIDNTESLTTAISPVEDVEFSRKKRQAPPQIFIYIGGGDDLPMYRGCIRIPTLKDGSAQPNLLTKSIRCGSEGTVCVGRPVFNGCNITEPEPVTELLNGHDNALSEGPLGRAESVIQPQPIVLSRDDYRAEGFDAQCVLPYRAATSGQKYVGDGYTKYYVKRFNPHSWRFSLVMRTREKSGIIFYMADARCNEHIAVYLVKGKIAFSIMFGGERLRLKSINRYDDEYWHRVTFERNGNMTQLMLDGSIEGMGLMQMESQTFPANMPFYVGGLHIVPKNFAANQINNKHLSDFTGCIKEFYVNNQPIESLGSAPGLRINVSPCFDGGTEPGMFFPYKEEHQPSAYMVAFNSFVIGVNVEITMDIKPRARDGLILAVGGTTGDFFNFALVDGSLAVRLRQGSETLFSRYDSAPYGYSLCDGAWHSVRISKAKNIVALIVDDNLVVPIEEGDLENRHCNTNGALYVGGIQEGVYMNGLLTNSQYAGCIRKLRFDNQPVNPTTAMSVQGEITTNTCPLF